MRGRIESVRFPIDPGDECEVEIIGVGLSPLVGDELDYTNGGERWLGVVERVEMSGDSRWSAWGQARRVAAKEAAPHAPDSSPFDEPTYENVEQGIGFVDRWHERRSEKTSDARTLRLLTWPVGFVVGFVRGASSSFADEFHRAYRAQRRRP